jgi:hypothetical protein
VDIGVASLIYWTRLPTILQSIASGLIGKASYDGGLATVVLGILLQWAMSILIAAIYLTVTAVRPNMRCRWQLMGVAAGVAIFLVMRYLVVPLSAAPFRPQFTIEGLFSHFRPYDFCVSLLAMILFGLIISFCARNASPEVVAGPAAESTA